MFCIRKKCLIILIGILPLLMSGCYGVPDEQTNKGREIMEEYLSGRDPESYSVDTAYKELERTAPDSVTATCFVHGDYSLNGETYEYWVNTDTQEIFTSERIEEFRQAGYDLMLEKLGIDPEDCRGTCDIISDSPRSYVMPVDVDIRDYIRNGFDDGEVGIAVWLAVKGEGFTEDRWTLADTSDWNKSKAYIEIISDVDEPFPDGFGIYRFKDWKGDKYSLSKDNIEYSPGIAVE